MNKIFTIAIFGAKGMLGSALHKKLEQQHTVIPLDIQDCDIANFDQTLACFFNLPKIDIIINCAAFTDVEASEAPANLTRLLKCNYYGPANLAKIAKLYQCKLIHFSTDYVFDGSKSEPYETMDDPNPINKYGWSKLLGERVIQEINNNSLILRISWLYGSNGKNFVSTILNVLRKADGKPIKVIDDQFGHPTATEDIAELFHCQLATVVEVNGIEHLTHNSYTTWYHLARFIAKEKSLDVDLIQPCMTEAYGFKAKRPRNSRLKQSYLNLSYWQNSVSRYLETIPREIS